LQINHGSAAEEDDHCKQNAQIERVSGEEKPLQAIDGRHPTANSPADVVSHSIVHNVDGLEVASFPHEKLEHEQHDQRDRHGHRKTQVMKLFILFEGTRQRNQSPEHHRNATIDQLLERHSKNGRIQLHSLEKVENNIVRKVDVTCAWMISTLEIEQHAKQKRTQLHRRNQLSERIHNPTETKHTGVVKKKRKQNGDPKSGQSIQRIFGLSSFVFVCTSVFEKNKEERNAHGWFIFIP
jgi:hypothetical protein